MGSHSRKDREQELEGINLLELAPRRLAAWEEDHGNVIVIRQEPESRGPRGLMDRFLHKMSAHRIRLDDVGGFAWKQFDGVRTVAEVGELMRREFGDRVEPVEERLGQLVLLLRKEGFLAYTAWDDEG